MNQLTTHEMYFPVGQREVRSTPLIVFSYDGQERAIMNPEDLPDNIAEWPDGPRVPFSENKLPDVPPENQIACMPIDWPIGKPPEPITIVEALGMVSNLCMM